MRGVPSIDDFPKKNFFGTYFSVLVSNPLAALQASRSLGAELGYLVLLGTR
jgi:hypothetical protein